MLRHENNQKPAYYDEKKSIKMLDSWALYYHWACVDECSISCEHDIYLHHDFQKAVWHKNQELHNYKRDIDLETLLNCLRREPLKIKTIHGCRFSNNLSFTKGVLHVLQIKYELWSKIKLRGFYVFFQNLLFLKGEKAYRYSRQINR